MTRLVNLVIRQELWSSQMTGWPLISNADHNSQIRHLNDSWKNLVSHLLSLLIQFDAIRNSDEMIMIIMNIMSQYIHSIIWVFMVNIQKEEILRTNILIHNIYIDQSKSWYLRLELCSENKDIGFWSAASLYKFVHGNDED